MASAAIWLGSARRLRIRTRSMDFGVPMLPSETSSLFARNELGITVQTALAGYCHADEFGGIYIDNVQGGVVVLLWTGDLATHETAIRSRLAACHPVQFRKVRWSEQELRLIPRGNAVAVRPSA